MKFLLVALLVGACLSVSWPSVSSTKTIGSPITVKAGQTFDGFAKMEINGSDMKEEDLDLEIVLMLKEVKLMLFSF